MIGLVGALAVAAGLASPRVDANVCPYRDDRDRDRVKDWRDKCPGSPLTVPVDGRGCPTRAFHLKDDVLTLGERVHFGFSDAKLHPQSERYLDALAAELAKTRAAHWQLEYDFSSHGGRREWMHALAQKRAEALRDALIQRGVQPELLSARGFPPERVANGFSACCPQPSGARVRLVRLDREASIASPAGA